MKNYLDLVEKVDEEKLYSHIYNLQGIRHPIVAREALIDAYKYIISEFEKIGIEVIEEDFEIEGFDIPFKNIIGKLDLSNGTTDEVIIAGHHDTVFNAPGANDNATAVAIVIETARIIYENQNLFSGNYRFVSFDLEEGNPIMQKKIWDLGKKFGVHEKDTFTKLEYKKNYGMLFSSFFQFKTKESREKLRLKVKETKLDENERDFYYALLDYFSISFKDGEWLGVSNLVGSTHYVSQAKTQGRKIKGLINIDTVGYTSNKKNSQSYPKGIPVNLLKLITKPILKSIPFLTKNFKTTGVKDVTVGDFASLLVDINSTSEADLFINEAKQVNLKVAAIYTGLDYANISISLPDLLRADHAPFWRDNIHAIFISDSANFRCPHYHTGSDTIEHVNFDFVKKIAQASLLTMIAMAEENIS
jgi:hypothetical protein